MRLTRLSDSHRPGILIHFLYPFLFLVYQVFFCLLPWFPTASVKSLICPFVGCGRPTALASSLCIQIALFRGRDHVTLYCTFFSTGQVVLLDQISPFRSSFQVCPNLLHLLHTTSNILAICKNWLYCCPKQLYFNDSTMSKYTKTNTFRQTLPASYGSQTLHYYLKKPTFLLDRYGFNFASTKLWTPKVYISEQKSVTWILN
jgi:hypothetical protein